MKNLFPTLAAFVIVLSAASCQGNGGEESWRSYLSESDRLAAGQDWEQATEYALLLLGDQKGMALLKTEIFQNAIDQAMGGLTK